MTILKVLKRAMSCEAVSTVERISLVPMFPGNVIAYDFDQIERYSRLYPECMKSLPEKKPWVKLAPYFDTALSNGFRNYKFTL